MWALFNWSQGGIWHLRYEREFCETSIFQGGLLHFTQESCTKAQMTDSRSSRIMLTNSRHDHVTPTNTYIFGVRYKDIREGEKNVVEDHGFESSTFPEWDACALCERDFCVGERWCGVRDRQNPWVCSWSNSLVSCSYILVIHSLLGYSLIWLQDDSKT